jgi:adenylylsulfate kinase-like enzyme
VVLWIDGDKFRKATCNQDFSDEGRERNLRNAAIKAAEFEEEALVICSFIAPRKEWRDMMRGYWKESLVVYIPGGALWPGTGYEIPDFEELTIRRNK